MEKVNNLNLESGFNETDKKMHDFKQKWVNDEIEKVTVYKPTPAQIAFFEGKNYLEAWNALPDLPYEELSAEETEKRYGKRFDPQLFYQTRFKDHIHHEMTIHSFSADYEYSLNLDQIKNHKSFSTYRADSDWGITAMAHPSQNLEKTIEEAKEMNQRTALLRLIEQNPEEINQAIKEVNKLGFRPTDSQIKEYIEDSKSYAEHSANWNNALNQGFNDMIKRLDKEYPESVVDSYLGINKKKE